jgi:DNA-binding NarL/FixJ family response regulator
VTTRVLIADDQSMVRHGFRIIVDSEEDLEVVAEAADGEQAVSSSARFNPDVVLMDIRMPNMDGLEATRRILDATPGTRVLVLTTFDLDDYVYEALRIGASGFLLKNSSPEDLIRAIRAVARGEGMLDPAITHRVIERFANTATATPETVNLLNELSVREQEVLELIARGQSNQEIADGLFLSLSTVKSHVTALLAKLELRDRTQAVIFAYETGLVAPGDAR